MPDSAARDFNTLDTGAQNFLFGYRMLHALGILGVKHLVISPGSRSTPLTLAAAHLSKTGLFDTHMHLDERSAAFFALGTGKATGVPAVLICTSGTAVANYYPAVIEARMTATPLIVISADRPAGQQNVMAPQTIAQAHIFGQYPVLFEQSEEVVFSDSYGSDTASLAHRLYRASITKAGPVHLNAAFRKPLEPDQTHIPSLMALANSQSTAIIEEMETQSEETNISEPDGLTELFRKLNGALRPLIITGPLNASSTAERELLQITLQQAHIPHLLEGSSGMQHQAGANQYLNAIGGYEGFLRDSSVSAELKPDFILRVGPPAVSRAVNEFQQSCRDVEQWCFSSTEHIPDPGKTSSRFLKWAPFSRIPRQYSSFSAEEKPTTTWRDAWQQHSRAFTRQLAELFPTSNTDKPLTDGKVIHTLLDYYYKQATQSTAEANHRTELFISNSFSVRDLDLFNPRMLPFSKVYHNRGASGIDGILSTALGVCTGAGRPLWVVLGDLSFLHDTNALLQLARHKGAPLRILVLNNSGGTIFRMLPVSSHSSEYVPYFETPQQVDFSRLCGAYGVELRQSTDALTLGKQLHEQEGSQSPVIIFEAITSTEASMSERQALWNTSS